jgi:DNA-binding response OmpR family regulator
LRRRRIDAKASSQQERIEFPGLVIDLTRRRVVAQGSLVELTAAQFNILALLASHPGWVYSRGQIMATVWGTDFSGDSRAADMQIRNIREKIEPEPKNPRYVLTARGIGYKFAEI